MNIQPVTLTGRVVRLEPLAEAHTADLARVGLDPDIWRFMLYGNIDSEVKMLGFVQDLLARQARGTDLPFAAVHLGTGRAIGCTRYMNLDRANRGLEIGAAKPDAGLFHEACQRLGFAPGEILHVDGGYNVMGTPGRLLEQFRK